MSKPPADALAVQPAHGGDEPVAGRMIGNAVWGVGPVAPTGDAGDQPADEGRGAEHCRSFQRKFDVYFLTSNVQPSIVSEKRNIFVGS
jgi:hypothetical protein